MTTIQCGLSECRAWLNGTCTRRTVKVVGMKCLDFTRRRSRFGHTTTTVQCDQKMCLQNYGGVCTEKELRMKGDGCEPLSRRKVEGNEGRRSEGSRQIPIRR